MKNLISLLAVLILQTTNLSASENASSVSAEVGDAPNPSLITKGYHLGALVLPTHFQIISDTGPDKDFRTMSPLALSLGYTNFESQHFGWSTQFNFSSISDSNINHKVSILRWDGNVAYSINSVYSLKLGPNVTRRFGASKFSRSVNDLVRSHGLGYQAQLNVKASAHWLLNIGYSKTTSPNLSGDGFRISGAELEMSYLF